VMIDVRVSLIRRRRAPPSRAAGVVERNRQYASGPGGVCFRRAPSGRWSMPPYTGGAADVGKFRLRGVCAGLARDWRLLVSLRHLCPTSARRPRRHPRRRTRRRIRQRSARVRLVGRLAGPLRPHGIPQPKLLTLNGSIEAPSAGPAVDDGAQSDVAWKPATARDDFRRGEVLRTP